MSYLYAVRFAAPENALILSLRQEMYTEPYDQINWPAQRNNVAPIDIYSPHTKLANGLFAILGVYEQCSFPPLRHAALKKTYRLIVEEDENTTYQTLGPVNKMMNLVCRTYVDGIGSEAWKEHAIKRKDFMWMCKDGMMMCGTNGSQLWDIAFISQALVKTHLGYEEGVKESAVRALRWLDDCQIKDNPKHYESAYRHASKGAWPFSTREQSYTVSDCVGEGLKAVLFLQEYLE
jgi:lanosterol synthase